jgi:hypothetical protein
VKARGQGAETNSALAFALALVPFGFAAFIALSHLFTCPANHPGCDLPDMAAFGIAAARFRSGPVVGA